MSTCEIPVDASYTWTFEAHNVDRLSVRDESGREIAGGSVTYYAPEHQAPKPYRAWACIVSTNAPTVTDSRYYRHKTEAKIAVAFYCREGRWPKAREVNDA